ncbi:MAG: hydantoinase/oxoprolinase family protein [Betaproteobacteria bacterium]|nr:hydantoinase/oxoprolinase family protein [Betaproteobacteria bacterium]
MSVLVAVDTGGTFTDLVTFDSHTRRVGFTKSLTTSDDPIRAILTCLKKLEVELDQASLFKHGTTLVINTLIERSGPRIALITTRGFRDILDFGRGSRVEPFNLFYRRDPPLVPRNLRFELDERVDGEGKVQVSPMRSDVETLAATLRLQDVAAVAVSFINSYIEPKHEKIVAEWLREILPACYVTTGTELTREWYEYERTATAAANAYSGPNVGRYVAKLNGALKSEGFAGQLFMMGSNGGVLSPQYAAAAPAMLVESGPVGGCIGAGAYARELGFDNLIAFDMGGTTAKCALIRNGQFNVESIYYVGGYGRGTPIRAPVIDIVEVGAGGGSIAWLDGQKALKVGPKSAGSFPGPVAYGRGGTQPTVTDANLVLGRLNAKNFQGGEMELDLEAARRMLTDRLARPLGYEGEAGLLRIASGVLSIAAMAMSEAIKQITVKRGQDPQDFTLFAYGGGGPLHALDLARELAIQLVVIPIEASNFSALGMLLADIRRDDSRTFLKPLNDAGLSAMFAISEEMEHGMRTSLHADFGSVPIYFARTAELRFVGQYHSVRIPVADGDSATLRRSFIDAYRERYGHAMENAAVEFVSLHCAGFAETPKPDIASLADYYGAASTPVAGTRQVFYPQVNSLVETAVFARRSLPIGFAAAGPAVIEEYGSTTVIGPTDRFEIGALGEIRITVGRNQ